MQDDDIVTEAICYCSGFLAETSRGRSVVHERMMSFGCLNWAIFDARTVTQTNRLITVIFLLDYDTISTKSVQKLGVTPNGKEGTILPGKFPTGKAENAGVNELMKTLPRPLQILFKATVKYHEVSFLTDV